MKNTIKYLLIATIASSSSVFAQTNEEAVQTPASEAPATGPEVNDLSLDDILSLTVTTASKKAETINRTTSVMSVITAKDIKRTGARNLYEVLYRIPGFFPTTQATWTLTGSRGLVSDGTDHILLLIDGHKQNSILENGYQQQDFVPNLEMVERIEIVRGPGSVLWGSSAAWGIINVITKDNVGDKASVSVGYSSADKLKTVNLLQGIESGEIKGFVSLSYWEAQGYNHKDEEPNVKFNWGAESNIWPKLQSFRPSYDMYSKVKLGEKTVVKARMLDMATSYPWDSWAYDKETGKFPGSELRTRKMYLDYTRSYKTSETVGIDLNLFADQQIQNRFPLQINTDIGADAKWREDMSREESSLGFELSGKQETEKNTLNFGIKYVYTKAGPNRSNRFDTDTNLPTVPDAGQDQVNVVSIAPGEDNESGIYIQDRYSLTDKLDIFGGVRADNNDWRENKVAILPRAGVIYSLSETQTIKAIVNTGYLRPNAVYSKSGGKFFRSPSKTIEDVNVVDKSEQIESADLQYYYASGKDSFAATLFYTKIKDYISWETALDMGYRTVGDATTIGLELEGKNSLTDNIGLNWNYSYALGKVDKIGTGIDHTGAEASILAAVTNDEKEWLNYPKHLYNIGIDYIMAQSSFNANLRGWADMNIVDNYKNKSSDADPDASTGVNEKHFNTLKGEQYLDIAYRANGILRDTDLTVFVTNLLDNQNDVGMVINNGTYTPKGRNIGALVTYNF